MVYSFNMPWICRVYFKDETQFQNIPVVSIRIIIMCFCHILNLNLHILDYLKCVACSKKSFEKVSP